MSKVGTFFEMSGKKTLVSAGSKKRDDLNFKFFKMLLARSSEFSSFVELVYKKEIEEHLDVMEFQCIIILRQLVVEAEERKKKREEMDTKKPQMTPDEGEEVAEETPTTAVISGIQRKTSVQNRARTESDAILYEEDEEELPVKPLLQKRASNVDDKTKEYLAFVKKLQYEDEYDDTHDVGDGRMNRRGRGDKFRNDRRRRDRSDDSEPEEDEIEKGSGFPVENEGEDSGEEFDPMNKWERTQSNMKEDEEDGPLQRNAFRGGRGRGGDRSTGGHKVDGKREKYNQSKYGGGHRKEDDHRDNRDHQGGHYHKKEDDYRQREREADNRDDYRPRGNDRDFKPRTNDYRDDNRGEFKERNDRGRQGQYGKPKQGTRDTR